MREALANLLLVIRSPKYLGIADSDPLSTLLHVPRMHLRVSDVWAGTVDCPFELIAIKQEPNASTLMMLRLRPPVSALAQSGVLRRRHPGGTHARLTDLYYGSAAEHARAYPLPRAARSERKPHGWDGLVSRLVGLGMESVSRREEPTEMKRYGEIARIGRKYFARKTFKSKMAPAARTWEAMLRTICTDPPGGVPLGGADERALLNELRDGAGLNLLRARDKEDLLRFLERAGRLGEAVERSRRRLRAEWQEVPPGLVTDEFRAELLTPKGWRPAVDRDELARDLSGLVDLWPANEPLPAKMDPPPGLRWREVPVAFAWVERRDELILAPADAAGSGIAFVLYATFRIADHRPRFGPG